MDAEKGLLEFGPFQADTTARVLMRDGEIVPLPPRAFDLLVALLESGGRSLTRDELLTRIWGDIAVEEANLTQAMSVLRKALGENAQEPSYIATLPRRGYRFNADVRTARSTGRCEWSTASDGPPPNSIVVLPFANMSTEGDSEFFSDGLTEEITNALAAVPGIRVVARTTAFQFKGKPVDIRQLGERLNVSAVLEGSVRRQGSRLRVTAQLNSAHDGYQYWSKIWDRDLTDVFAIQEDVARGVVESVRNDVGPNTPLVHPPTRDLEAYNLYLQGRFYEHRVFSTEKAIGYFERAIAKDSRFALAYTGLATCYADLGYYHQASPKDVYPKAVSALRRALDLDPVLARAHALEGLIALVYDWDWPTAERRLRRAMELNPADAEVHDFYSHFLVTLGRFDESLAESQKAIEIDPLDQVRLGHLAWHYLMAREPRHAIEASQQALDIDPRHVPTLASLQWAYEALGLFD